MSKLRQDRSIQIDRTARSWTLADQAYEQVLTLIIEGEFPPGTRLPTEVSLSEQMGVSRPILRQALKRLREDGVVISRQGSGSFVQKQPDRAVLNFAPVGSIADIQRTFEFRATIEPDAAALAARRWSSQDMIAIKQGLAELDKCIDEGSLGANADEELHVSICAATDNHYYVSARASMKSQILIGMNLARRLTLAASTARLELVQKEHYALVAAIERRDADEAKHLMRQHIKNARARVFQGFGEAVGSSQ